MTTLPADLLALVDAADGALDRDTYDQFRRDGAGDWPHDMAIEITVGTRRKINAVFQAIDRIRKNPPTAGETASALLAALKVAEKAIDDCLNCRSHLNYGARDQVRAAIAKAEDRA